jgi:hypothetical protein
VAPDSDDGNGNGTPAPGGGGGGKEIETFYLQYFFPPSSVGETGRVGPVGESLGVWAGMLLLPAVLRWIRGLEVTCGDVMWPWRLRGGHGDPRTCPRPLRRRRLPTVAPRGRGGGRSNPTWAVTAGARDPHPARVSFSPGQMQAVCSLHVLTPLGPLVSHPAAVPASARQFAMLLAQPKRGFPPHKAGHP